MTRLKLIVLRVISWARQKLLGKNCIAVIYKSNNGLMASPVEDLVIGKHLGFNRGWNLSELKELDKHILKTDCLYVIGTHIGTLLIPLSKKTRKVYGYEANPDTYKFLEWNISLNNISNAEVFNYAVGDSKRKLQFYANKINSGGSKIKPIIDKFIYNYDNPNVIEVDMIDLDNHITSEKLPPPNVIIMDIEGAEYLALKGGQVTLSKVRILYMEYVPHHLTNVANIDNKSLLNLILVHFNTVQSMQTSKTFELDDNSKYFENYLDELMKLNKSDDLLFLKTIPNKM